MTAKVSLFCIAWRLTAIFRLNKIKNVPKKIVLSKKNIIDFNFYL